MTRTDERRPDGAADTARHDRSGQPRHDPSRWPRLRQLTCRVEADLARRRTDLDPRDRRVLAAAVALLANHGRLSDPQGGPVPFTALTAAAQLSPNTAERALARLLDHQWLVMTAAENPERRRCRHYAAGPALRSALTRGGAA